MITLYSKLIDHLVKIELALSAAIGFFLGLLVFSSAVMRYVVGTPISFSDELVALLFVMTCLLCMPFAARANTNIRLDILVKRFSNRSKKYFMMLTYVASMVVLILFANASLEEVLFSREIEEVTLVAEIPVYPFKALAVFCVYSVVFALFANLLELLFTSKAGVSI